MVLCSTWSSWEQADLALEAPELGSPRHSCPAEISVCRDSSHSCVLLHWIFVQENPELGFYRFINICKIQSSAFSPPFKVSVFLCHTQNDIRG